MRGNRGEQCHLNSWLHTKNQLAERSTQTPPTSFLQGAREHSREEISKRKGSYQGSFSLLFLYLPEEVLSGSGEVLELENPGIIPWEILFGVPWRSPEALQPPVLLEPTEQARGMTNSFTNCSGLPAPSVVQRNSTPSESKGSKANISSQERSCCSQAPRQPALTSGLCHSPPSPRSGPSLP